MCISTEWKWNERPMGGTPAAHRSTSFFLLFLSLGLTSHIIEIERDLTVSPEKEEKGKRPCPQICARANDSPYIRWHIICQGQGTERTKWVDLFKSFFGTGTVWADKLIKESVLVRHCAVPKIFSLSLFSVASMHKKTIIWPLIRKDREKNARAEAQQY